MRAKDHTTSDPLLSRCLVPVVALSLAGLLSAVAASAASPAPMDTTTPLPFESANPLRLEVNIPAARVDALLNGRIVASYPATVGSPRNPTPDGSYEIDRVIWNPWWHPPAHRRPKDKVTSPGPRNPMGRVKLQFSTLYYVHGTAKEAEIGRATSRGCVRLRNEDALALARLVHAYAGPDDLAPEELAALEASPRRTRHIALPRPVPVRLVYRVAEVRDGHLELYGDPYRMTSVPLAEAVHTALSEAGLAPRNVDRAAIDELLAEGVPARLPLSALVARPEERDLLSARNE